MEGEGWSLRHSRHRRRFCGEARRVLYERRRPPPHRGGDASARRGLSGQLFLAEHRRARDRVTPKSRSKGTMPKRATSAKARKCPICGKAAVPDYCPFCSRACADEDLRRWLGGHYIVPGERVGPEGDEEAED